jgi:hypothetical protein
MEYKMEQVKSMIASRTVWAALVSAILWALTLAGKNVTGIDPNSVTDVILQIVGGLSSLLAIFFRVTATAQISGVVKTPEA